MEIDLGRREMGFGRWLSGWGRERWDGALSFHLREINPFFRPPPHSQPARAQLATPPQLVGKRSQPYPPPQADCLQMCQERGGVGRSLGGWGCREGKLKKGGEIHGSERGRHCGHMRKPVKMRKSQKETVGEGEGKGEKRVSFPLQFALLTAGKLILNQSSDDATSPLPQNLPWLQPFNQ